MTPLASIRNMLDMTVFIGKMGLSWAYKIKICILQYFKIMQVHSTVYEKMFTWCWDRGQKHRQTTQRRGHVDTTTVTDWSWNSWLPRTTDSLTTMNPTTADNTRQAAQTASWRATNHQLFLFTAHVRPFDGPENPFCKMYYTTY